jgi:hypothetical protein
MDSVLSTYIVSVRTVSFANPCRLDMRLILHPQFTCTTGLAARSMVVLEGRQINNHQASESSCYSDTSQALDNHPYEDGGRWFRESVGSDQVERRHALCIASPQASLITVIRCPTFLIGLFSDPYSPLTWIIYANPNTMLISASKIRQCPSTQSIIAGYKEPSVSAFSVHAGL